MTSAPAAAAGPALQRGFEPQRWLREAHLQSTLPSLPPRRQWTRWRSRAVRSGAQPWMLDCGSGVRLLAWYTRPRTPPTRTAVLLHGWEGSVDSCYVLSLAASLHARGYAILRLNLRDHGGTQALNQELFHSCRLSDVTGALRAIAARSPGQSLYLAGFSLGGNFLLRACAEPGLPPAVRVVVAVSPVLEPARTLRALEEGWPLYHRYFVHHWSRSLRRKQRLWPGVYDFGAMLRTKSLRLMTDALVRVCTEFADSACYLDGYSITGARLQTLTVPARILMADDDPMIPIADQARLAPTPYLVTTRTARGGHCGYLTSLLGPAYSDQFAMEQFARF